MNKKALLVGINDYGGIGDLRGCINDVTNIRNILKTFFGFTNESIRVLIDARATKENILTRLDKMITQSQAGDFLLFHFSGHGSQIRDLENDELKDHMDELICPYDMNWDDGFITDDMLGRLLEKLPGGVHMEVILDCCHSGTGTREVLTGQPEELGPFYPVLNRYLMPPVDIACRYEGEDQLLKSRRAFIADKRIIMNHILWAGCKDNQTASDALIHGSYHGAFTYYFCKHIRENQGSIIRDDLYQRVCHSLRYHQYHQVPQLECDPAFKHAEVLTAPSKKHKV
jgi:hypothetical protein